MPQPTTNNLEGAIEKLAMAITHSEQGEYAKNEEYVRAILNKLQEDSSTNNLEGWREIFYKKFVFKETDDTVARLNDEVEPEEMIKFISDLRKHDMEELIKGLLEPVNEDEEVYKRATILGIKRYYKK